MMRMSAAGRQKLTERFEGLVLHVYPDPGTGGRPLTAGYGHTGPDVVPGMIVSQAQADAWLESDIARAEAAVNKSVTIEINQNQFDALTDFAYNAGIGAFETSTLLRLVNAGQFAAADEQFGRWVHSHGQALAGLVARRDAEAKLFASGPPANESPTDPAASRVFSLNRSNTMSGFKWALQDFTNPAGTTVASIKVVARSGTNIVSGSAAPTDTSITLNLPADTYTVTAQAFDAAGKAIGPVASLPGLVVAAAVPTPSPTVVQIPTGLSPQ